MLSARLGEQPWLLVIRNRMDITKGVERTSQGISRPTTLRAAEDPLMFVADALTKAKTVWMWLTSPFAGFGRDVSIHYTCEIRTSAASVYLASASRLSVPEICTDASPRLSCTMAAG
jgi:hypothetical protein